MADEGEDKPAPPRFKEVDLMWRKTVEPGNRRTMNKQLHEFENLKQDYKVRVATADKLKKMLDSERDNLTDLNSSLEEARNRLSDAQEEIDADYLPEGAQPRPRIANRDKLYMEVNQLEAAQAAQSDVVKRVTIEYNAADRKMFEADRGINRFAETLEDTKVAMKVIKELDDIKKDHEHKITEDIKTRKAADKKAVDDAKEAQRQELAELTAKNAKITKDLTKDAVKTLAKSLSKTAATTRQMKEMHDKQHATRVEAVMELKTNQDAVFQAVSVNATANRKKIAAAKKKLEDEREDYISRGLNPYVEFRKAEFEEEATKREKRMKETVEKNQKTLAERFRKEEIMLEKQEDARKDAREANVKHRDSQGRWVTEDKTRAYIASKTSSGLEVLDPSGRAARVDPSQITDIPDYTLGTGIKARIPEESMRRITEKMREELKVDNEDIGEYKRLVAGLLKKAGIEEGGVAGAGTGVGMTGMTPPPPGSAPGMKRTGAGGGGGGAVPGSVPGAEDDDEAAMLAMLDDPDVNAEGNEKDLSSLEGLADRPGAVPGADKTATIANYGGNEIKKDALLKIVMEEEGEIYDPNKHLSSVTKRKYSPRKQSQFERDSLNRAKDRATSRIEEGVEQMAGGRTFKGDSFIAKPDKLIFKDFEVGKSYKKTFILTNVSYTFNSFKLLPLDDSVIDFFIITYEKPGRMSAGVSCILTIDFTPELNHDIYTYVKLLTQTGPVNIPLHCLIKRCAPSIQNIEAKMDFDKVVMGQKTTAMLTITNTEALPTTFSIMPIGLGSYEDEREGEGEGAGSAPTSARGPSAPTSARRGSEGAVPGNEDNEGAGLVQQTPAEDENELNMRVRRVITEVVRRKKRENPYPLSSSMDVAKVTGYGKISVPIVCAPLTVGPIEQVFSVVFDGVQDENGTKDPEGRLITREQMVTVRAEGMEVPIYVEEETIDLRTCLYGRIYRQRVILKNRASAAYRVTIKVPAEHIPYLEVSPTMLFVQAKMSQSINIKFTPTKALMNGLAHFTVPYQQCTDSAMLNLPVEIQVVNQEIPAYFVLKANVTPSTIDFSTHTLDFGNIYVGQRSMRNITVRNTSMLPQKVAFVRLRKEFLVSPNEGFAVLLPNESLTFEVSFSPQTAINYEVDLILTTSLNDTYPIRVIAQGVASPLELSSAVIHMRTTPPGERVTESTLVTNATKHSQTFEVIVPDKRFSWITVSPTVMNLAPGQTGRLEVEFLPPQNLPELLPSQWHEKTAEVIAKETPKEEEPAADEDSAGGPVVPGSIFNEWVEQNDWFYGHGMFGTLQWTKTPARQPKANDDPAEEEEGEEKEGGGGEGGEEEKGESETKANEAAEKEKTTGKEGDDNDGEEKTEPLPVDEWGVVGSWSIPILLKPRKKHVAAVANSGDQQSRVGSPDKRAAPLYPLFVTIQTAVCLPQVDANTKLVDFGQISVGVRQLKTFKIFNKLYQSIKLESVGLNAIGPFTLLRPIKEIGSRESATVIVECYPELPGLVVEVLEIMARDQNEMGHRIRVTIRVQGLKPSISLEDLSPPPANWSAQCGIMDFGNRLMMDTVTKKFKVRNESSFEIDASLVRIVGHGLSPMQQAELVERTAVGLPVFSIRPERVRIPTGSFQEIEVTFRPDRGRFNPYREDIDILIGKTDETYRVGLAGRSWARQLIVVPANPLDEAFVRPEVQQTSRVEDVLAAQGDPAIRALAKESRETLKINNAIMPCLTLVFPDPYAKTADPTTYKIVAAKIDPKAKVDPGASAKPVEVREQRKILQMCSTVVTDGRPGLGPGSYEILLSEEAKASGLWLLSAEKGNVAVDGNPAACDVVCTLPKPRSLGGLFVGSWQTFSAVIVLKGGWRVSDEEEENRVPLTVRAFVSL